MPAKIDEEKLNSIYIPHLRGQLQQGQAILFLGAGFSADAKNIAGTQLPIGADLARQYWTFCFPGKKFEEGTSLQDLYEDARVHHRADLKSLSERELTVSAPDLPSWYRTILSLPWLRIYTLNIDDLTDAASRAFTLPRPCRSLSATSRSKPESELPRANRLDVIHLNGTLQDLPDNVTFSVTQYAERLASRDPWYMQLAADLLTRSIVFIGTKLDEPPLWQHIVIRGHRGGRGYGEMRHRSYLVTPLLPSARETLLATFNVVWLPFSAKDFTEQVLEQVTDATDAGLKAIGATVSTGRESTQKLPEVAGLAHSPLEKTEYLLGAEPRWSDIQSGRAIIRQHEADIRTAVDRGLRERKTPRVIVITGTAASGKSTALMRACLRLSSEGRRVAWVDRYNTATPRQIVATMTADNGPDTLGIDDADMYGAELATIVGDVAKSTSMPLVLIEARSGRIDRVLNRNVMNGIEVDEISMPPLSDADIDDLLDILERENRLGELRGKTRENQRRVFKELCGRELLVAMYTATTGQEFQRKMVDEWSDLDGASRFIYGTCALATAHRFGLTRDELVVATGDRSNVALNELDRLIRRHLLVVAPTGGTIGVRHRLIARVLVDTLTQRGQLSDVVVGLLSAVSAKVSTTSRRESREARIIRVFINHEFLLRTVSFAQARGVYSELEPLLSWDYHYWLHRGALELEEGDISLAENFLGQAKGLGGSDLYVMTEWAYLLFRKACTYSGAVEAPDMVREATAILEEVIDRDGARSPYAFHVLGSQGLSWARRGIRSVEERARYLGALRLTVERGSDLHPTERELRQLVADLKREQLMLATPGYHS